MIQVSVNNEIKSVAVATLLSDALQDWGYADSKIAVAINQEFVPRSTYAERSLSNNDQIDIVRPVGGG
ncbi:sulfur carrier protein ThiS [Cellvibrio sp. KY-GH-1]|uniref:sulfur carrier protein ThiS n=1 Tax=Cellvibrio sp. KY-GH-1 TaxID=2303332 RepID=UPI001244830E|nr:sulfur carrier protein ThiS [Cellvibrio sp. KY-GH-1]QEY15447.1 sulfur carrier protein ThiS [Cellvibrio sp. KY-GH-1]